MHISLDTIRRTNNGVLVCATKGKVLLKRTRQGITAKYHSGPLVNGTAITFAERVKKYALNHALESKLPWSTKSDGSIEIHDHKQFYNQTFSTSTYALETLKRWSQK